MSIRLSTLLFGSVLSASVLMSTPGQAAIFGCDQDDLIRTGCSDGDVTGSIGSGRNFSSRDDRPEAQNGGSTFTAAATRSSDTPEEQTDLPDAPDTGPKNPDYAWMDDYKQRYTTRHLEPWNDYSWMDQYKDKYRELAERRWAEEGGPKDDLGWMDDETDTPAGEETETAGDPEPTDEPEVTETVAAATTAETTGETGDDTASEGSQSDESADTAASDGADSDTSDSSESDSSESEGGSSDSSGSDGSSSDAESGNET